MGRTVTTLADGFVSFEGLAIGRYRLVETQAAPMYVAPDADEGFYWIFYVNSYGEIGLPITTCGLACLEEGYELVNCDKDMPAFIRRAGGGLYLPNEREELFTSPPTGLDDSLAFYLSLGLVGASTLLFIRRYNAWKNKEALFY